MISVVILVRAHMLAAHVNFLCTYLPDFTVLFSLMHRRQKQSMEGGGGGWGGGALCLASLCGSTKQPIIFSAQSA